MSERIETVKAVMAAWARHDIDELMSHMHPDVEWHYQVGSRPAVGADAMRKILDKLQHHQLESRWRLVHHAETDDRVLIEAIDDFVNPDGRRVRAPYMGVYEFDGDLISHWRDYVDMGVMMASERGEPTPEWIEPLVADDRGS